MAEAQRGDRASVDALLRRHLDAIHGVCRRITGNDADAADATQEALIAVVRGLPRFDGRSAFSTWVYRVATNACLDELRRKKRRPDPVDDDELLVSGGAGGDARESLASQAALKLDVDAALRRLPVEFRAPVVLRDLSGLDYAEISEVLDVPVGTVKSRISRGRAMLADLLQGNPSPPPDRRTP
ncbi:MAG TPA: sigma-70 family RNA polymerase sigma factor [Acidimicrobiales bacterium]|nr:sigma-70 family RNA polymerase sigma factor [Acidimicrobiales bacterium]